MEFGRKLKLKEFCFDGPEVHVNHGSYGAVPRTVLDHQIRMLEECEKNAEQWHRYESEGRYLNAVTKVADFIECRQENVVLVENATAGTNAVIKSLKWKDNDAILITNTTFVAVKTLVRFIADEYKATIQVITMDIPLPISDENDVINAYRNMIDKHPEIKLAIIDHITSSSALLMPVKKLVNICHDSGAAVLIDGAHCPGQVHLDLEDLNADFYVGNLHKWLFCPRGSALLWIHPNYHDIVHPVITSFEQFSSYMQLRYGEQGTRDAIPLFMAPYAIEFYQRLGGMTQISAYNTTLLEWPVDMLTQAWNTKPLPIVDSMKAPFMALVGIPDSSVTKKFQEELAINAQYCDSLCKAIRDRYHVYVTISHVMGKLWCRLSVQVYNCKEDYYSLRDAILEVTGEDIVNGSEAP